MRWKVRQFNQVLPIFEGLAKLLHTRFGTIHTIDALRSDQVSRISDHASAKSKIKITVGRKRGVLHQRQRVWFTLMLRARLSISDVHFLMIKGMPSGLFLAACAKSIPNNWSLPWSFLWPHWIASVSRHFLWHAKEHCWKQEMASVWCAPSFD